MRARVLALVGVSATALLAAGTFAPSATASSPAGTAGHTPAALSMTHHGTATATATAISKKKGKCKTAFGTPIAPSGDGIIDVAGSGFDVAGAADFKCGKKKKARTIKKVTVMGYNGDAGSMQFNVTVYANAASNEPNNGIAAVCATQTVTGTGTGSGYPTADTIVLTLANKCVANAGTNWIEVQAATDSGNVWYWETQSNQSGNPADWRDANGSFGSACTPGYVDGVYMQDCIFGGDNGEPDFMFMLG